MPSPLDAERRHPSGRQAMDHEHRESHPVPIPHRALSPEALRGVVDAFVLREGTDYGERDTSHAEKVRQVIAQIERGEAQIVYDPGTSSVGIVLVTEPSRNVGRAP
jgi:uncharacterized protein YheU (UPF0270 family)